MIAGKPEEPRAANGRDLCAISQMEVKSSMSITPGPARLYWSGSEPVAVTGEIEQFTTQYAARTGTMKKCISIAMVILLTLFITVFAEGEGYHVIPPVGIDISPGWGIPPDGNAEFQVDSELLEVPYEGIEQGTALVTAQVSSELRIASVVTVHNLTTGWIQDVVLTIENYGVFYGDPVGYIFLYDTVWNPPGLADGDVPAYPLGDIPPGGNACQT